MPDQKGPLEGEIGVGDPPELFLPCGQRAEDPRGGDEGRHGHPGEVDPAQGGGSQHQPQGQAEDHEDHPEEVEEHYNVSEMGFHVADV